MYFCFSIPDSGKVDDKGNGKTSAAIKCHFVYSITYRQPCFVPVANGFEKNDYRRLGTERGDADLAAFRLLCFVYARSAFGSKVYGLEPNFLSVRIASLQGS